MQQTYAEVAYTNLLVKSLCFFSILADEVAVPEDLKKKKTITSIAIAIVICIRISTMLFVHLFFMQNLQKKYDLKDIECNYFVQKKLKCLT